MLLLPFFDFYICFISIQQGPELVFSAPTLFYKDPFLVVIPSQVGPLNIAIINRSNNK